MMKFPRDAPKQKIIKTFERLGFRVVRMGNHISMVRENIDGSRAQECSATSDDTVYAAHFVRPNSAFSGTSHTQIPLYEITPPI